MEALALAWIPMQQIGGTLMRQEDASKVLIRDRYCVVCSRAVIDQGHIHHRKLRKQGGGDEASNLIVIHPPCHRWVHGNPTTAYEKGYLVHSWDEPEDVPVKFRDGRTAYLTTDGKYEFTDEGKQIWASS